MTQHVVNEPGRPAFRLVEFNPRRFSRGAPAALAEVSTGSQLWMDRMDIARNIRDWGPDRGLVDAACAYKNPQQEIRNGR